MVTLHIAIGQQECFHSKIKHGQLSQPSGDNKMRYSYRILSITDIKTKTQLIPATPFYLARPENPRMSLRRRRLWRGVCSAILNRVFLMVQVY